MRIDSMLVTTSRFLGAGILASLVALAMAIFGSFLGTLSRADLTLGDLRATFGTTPASGRTVIVGIDQETLAHHGGWPIARNHMATVLNRLGAAGARRVYVDSYFAAESHEQDNAALEGALKRLGPNRVALPVVILKGKPDAEGRCQPVKIVSMDRFARHTRAVSADMPFDRDNRVRSIGRTALGDVARQPTAAAWLASGRHAKPGISKIDPRIDLESIPVISFIEIERNGVPADSVNGKNIVVGLVAERVAQPVLVPRHGEIERAEFMALAAETLLLDSEPARVPLWIVIACTAVIVLLLGLCLPRFGILAGGALTLLTLVLLLTLSVDLQRRTGLELPLALPFAAMILTYAGTLVATHPAFRNMRQAAIGLLDKVDYGLARLFHSGVDAIITFSPDGRILTVNRSAEKLFGMPADALVDKPLSTVLPDTADTLLRAASGHLPGRLVATVADSTGQDRHVDLAFNAMPSETGWVGYASIRDITDMKAREEELKRQASHDGMTGLPNRAAFERHLDATQRFAAETGQPFAVFMLDLNKFKQVNDTLGHQIGDALLIEVAKRFENAMRKSDFVARLGGDEFAVVMAPPTARDGAEWMASLLVDSVAQLTELEGHAIETGTSIGVALYPEHAQRGDDLVRLADEAMYSAKRGKYGYRIASEGVLVPAG